DRGFARREPVIQFRQGHDARRPGRGFFQERNDVVAPQLPAVFADQRQVAAQRKGGAVGETLERGQFGFGRQRTEQFRHGPSRTRGHGVINRSDIYSQRKRTKQRETEKAGPRTAADNSKYTNADYGHEENRQGPGVAQQALRVGVGFSQ